MNGHTRLAALLALAALALPASAKTYYVNAATGNDANSGLKETLAFRTIQKAIDKAAAGSTILVAPGTYAPIRTSKKLTIKSTDGAETTIIDGSLGEHYVEPAVVVPEYVHGSYKWRYDETLDDYVETDEVEDYYYYAHANGDPIYGDEPWEEEDAEYRRWYPPIDENIWLTPPKPKTVKTKWDKWTERRAEIRYTDACVVLGKLDYFVKDWPDGWQSSGKTLASVAASISGFTLCNSHHGVLGGSAAYCVITGVTRLCAGMSALTDTEICGNIINGYAGTQGVGAITAATTLNRCIVRDNTVTVGACGFGNRFSLDDSWNFDEKTVWMANCLVIRNNASLGEWPWGPFVEIDVYNSTVADNVLVKKYPDDDSAAVGDCNVYNSIIWGNRDTYGNRANFYTETDKVTGETVLSGYEPYSYETSGYYYNSKTGEEKEVPYIYTHKPSAMVNCCVEDKVVKTSGSFKTQDWDWKKKKVVTKTVKYSPSKNNISEYPCFVDPANGDYHLAPNSPCKDAGADYTKKTGKYDMDSGARKVGKVDMGAYELQPQTAVPADYDGDGITDASFYFAASSQWWIFPSGKPGAVRTLSLPDRNATPCPADYDVAGTAEPAYFTAAAKAPEFVRMMLTGGGWTAVRTPFGTKGATPVAAKLNGAKATFGVYTANAKKPAFSFLGNPLSVTFGAKSSRPVVADFDADGKDDFGVYTATASKPAFSILQSSKGFSTASLFQGKAVALGAKGAIPCCADFDGDGAADFATYLSNTKAPYFSRLLSSTKFRETWTLPMGSKGDAPVVGVYETAYGPAALAVWTGSAWTYVDSDYADVDLLGD